MDKGNVKGNYLEATASAMFVYALAKAVNNEEISKSYEPAILKGYQGVLNEFVRTNDSGAVSLIQCCQVAGLGFKSTRGGPRDGSFEYYVSEPIVENDMKGIGPFILAGIEVQKLVGQRRKIKAFSLRLGAPASRRPERPPCRRDAGAPGPVGS